MQRRCGFFKNIRNHVAEIISIMYHRIFDIENRLDEAMFLFGGRQVGKSTLLKERFPKAVYIDLLNSELKNRYHQHPEEFRESLLRHAPETLVIVDEIQKVPDLLDEVHWLMVNKGLFFILSGSSARKLKKSGANNLGGRAIPETLFPLVSAEIPDFDLDRAIQNGMIPRHYMVANARNRLKSYIELYLKEEIIEEAAVQKVDDFIRFLEVAAISNGEMLNYENVATDCGVSANTVKAYYQILCDTLLGFEVPAYRKVIKRKLSKSSRFFFFDVGIANYLTGRHHLAPKTPEYGHAFEHLVMQEIVAYLGYKGIEGLFPKNISEGDVFTHQMELDMPETVLVKENAELVVLLLSKSGAILNAEKCPIAQQSAEPTAVEFGAVVQRHTEPAVYDLQGRVVSKSGHSLQPGIYIIGGKKVVVK